MKKIFILIAFVLSFLFTASSAFAENFYITDYDVNMKVNENKTINVTENIDVVFTNSSHGIFRTIPVKSGEDIYGINTSENYTTSSNGNIYTVKIGDPNRMITGSHHYTIDFNHKLAGNPNEFYYNIIGTDWDVPINKASFTVEMPKSFDPDKAGLSIGKYGTRGFNGGAVFNINGKTISGNTTTRSLNPHEVITLRVSLPSDYFSIAPDYTTYYVLFGMLLLTGISFLVWFFVGRDDHVTPVVNFYPPENYNSAEVEVLYSGKATEKGLVSLIIWLANKGYLKIYTSAGDFTITKVKDIETQTGHEYLSAFIDMLVPAKKISSSSLRSSNSFYKNCSIFIDRFNRIRERIFEKGSINPVLQFIMGTCIAGLVFLEFFIITDYNLPLLMQNIILLLFPLVAVSVLVANIKESSIFIILLWAIPFGGIPLLVFFMQVLPRYIDIPMAITGLICIIISGVCLYQLPKRNKTGNKILGQLLGFKKFLETVEKPRVQALVDENPNYCWDVLPYLYVFGISDKWIKQFEEFFRKPPEWYHGHTYFYDSFHNFTHNMKSYTEPSESNGGISHSSSGGGGGCSGGGSGGGGGGSW